MTRAEKIAARAASRRGSPDGAQQPPGIGGALQSALAKLSGALSDDSAVVERSDPDKNVVGAMAIGNDSYRMYVDNSMELLRGRRVYTLPNGTTPADDLFVTTLVDGIPIPTGLTIIFGGANEGKTPLLRYISRSAESSGFHGAHNRKVRYGEPLPGYFRDTDSLAREILSTVSDQGPRLITVDSFKNIIGRLGGSATVGGLSRELFPWFSDLSSFLAEAGVSMVTVLNVSSARSAVVDEVIEALNSNCTSTWLVQAGQVEWQARVGEGKRRANGAATITWGGDGIIERLHTVRSTHSDDAGWSPVTGPRDREPETVFKYGEITPNEMNRSIARMVRSTTPR